MSPHVRPRLIDLHINWLLQYAAETTFFESSLYEDLRDRIGQVEGYLGATSAAILVCGRRAADWARQTDPWSALGDLLARYEAEFSGRLLLGPDDLARRREDRDGLCWGLLGVAGFDALIREPADLDRLPGLFTRGVRLYQPIAAAASPLGGSIEDGDDRGLTGLGRDFLAGLEAVVKAGKGPLALLDLSRMSPRAAEDSLTWIESDAGRARRLIPVHSHGPLPAEGVSGRSSLSRDSLRRLRALGGLVGLTPASTSDTEAFAHLIDAVAEIPFEGRPGTEGLAIGTASLDVERIPSGLGRVDDLVDWFLGRFLHPTAEQIIHGNTAALLERVIGGAGERSKSSSSEIEPA